MGRSAVLACVLGLVLPGVAAPAWGAGAGERVYIGTIGAEGIFVARLDAESGRLSAPVQAVALARTQWLAADPGAPVLYAVGAPGGTEANGVVYSLAIDPASGALKVLGAVDSGGKDATYLTVDARSRTLLDGNYQSGTIGAFPIRADGTLGPAASVRQEVGSGPFPGRQAKAVAHCVAVDPSGRYVLVADLGADHVFVYRFDPATRALTLAGSQAVPPGSGPRHLAFDPKGRFVYLLTELTAEVHVLAWDGARGQLSPVQSLPVFPAGVSVEGSKAAAELRVSADGRFVYASLRGEQNSIVAYAVEAVTGRLREIQRIASGGKSPVSFAIDPTGRWMLVANDGSDSVTVLKVDRASGRLESTGQSVAAPKPRALLFRPD